VQLGQIGALGATGYLMPLDALKFQFLNL